MEEKLFIQLVRKDDLGITVLETIEVSHQSWANNYVTIGEKLKSAITREDSAYTERWYNS